MAAASTSASPSAVKFHNLLFLPSSFVSFPSTIKFSNSARERGALLQTCAKKKKNNSKRSRKDKDPIDSEFESMGFFPEAVLLKKKAVKEDGKVLPEFADAEEEKLYEALSIQLESSLKLERMRHYEVVFLIHEQHDEEVEEIVTKVEDFIREKKGRIWRLNDWGLRRLAYEVKKAIEAHYILMNFEIDTKFINDFKTMLDKDERVIRHLVTKQDKAETEYSPPPMDYQTLLAKQGLGDDDGFWDDDDDDYTMYDDDDSSTDEGYEDDGNVDGGEGDEEVIYVDGDEDPDEITDAARKVENVTR